MSLRVKTKKEESGGGVGGGGGFLKTKFRNVTLKN